MTLEELVGAALREQPWFMRRKDTIAASVGGLLQISNVAGAYFSDAPAWVNVLLAVVIGLLQVVVHAATPGAVTPSMATRLERTAERVDSPTAEVETTTAREPEPVAPGHDGGAPLASEPVSEIDGYSAGVEAARRDGAATPNRDEPYEGGGVHRYQEDEEV